MSQGERAGRVERNGVGQKSNPPIMNTGRKHARGKLSSSKTNIKRDRV